MKHLTRPCMDVRAISWSYVLPGSQTGIPLCKGNARSLSWSEHWSRKWVLSLDASFQRESDRRTLRPLTLIEKSSKVDKADKRRNILKWKLSYQLWVETPNLIEVSENEECFVEKATLDYLPVLNLYCRMIDINPRKRNIKALDEGVGRMRHGHIQREQPRTHRG